MFGFLGNGNFWFGVIVGTVVGGAFIHRFVRPLVVNGNAS